MRINVTVTGAGSHVLVFCSKCGPVNVTEGTADPVKVGTDHLKSHGCMNISLTPPEPQEKEGP